MSELQDIAYNRIAGTGHPALALDYVFKLRQQG